jgi:Xaa-Pro dipeptidase
MTSIHAGSANRSPGSMQVDWEDRVDMARLRSYRLGRVREQLERCQLGALLVLDTANIRYVTSTHIGYWAFNKLERYALITRHGEPFIWDFGSAAMAHRLGCSWIEPSHSRGGNTGLGGTIGLESGLAERAAAEVRDVLAAEGVSDEPLGVDVIDLPLLRALEGSGLHVVDGQQPMLFAREIKSPDEIVLLNQSAALVDATYQHIFETLKPGVRESDIVALANSVLYGLGSEHVECVNSIAGERCSPHPHVFSDRVIRPGDQAYFDIVHAYNGYRTCYYRTFAVGRELPGQRDAYRQAREWIDAAIALIKPGVSTDEIAAVWPSADRFGFENELEAFGLQFGHGVGLSVHERPVISRLNSLEHPIELREGMVFALETYCPAADGRSAARIEEEVVCTSDGPVVLTRFPSEDLMVANAY